MEGYTAFGKPILLDSGNRVMAWFPKQDNPDRRWMVWVCNFADGVVDEQYIPLGNNPYGPTLDDVLKLESVTKKMVEEYS